MTNVARMAHLHETRQWTAAEFFAGIGLARLGLESAGVEVIWSNDIAATKQAMFAKQFGETSRHKFVAGDLGTLSNDVLPTAADLAWASFPCTDLSVAGGRAGLHRGIASSTFWHFIKTLSKLGDKRPRVVALENVTAFATSHAGRDIESAIRSLNGLGYSVDILNIDARHFVPQSRPRLFLVGLRDRQHQFESDGTDEVLRPSWLDPIFDDPTLETHRMALPSLPPAKTDGIGDYLEDIDPRDERWWPPSQVAAYSDSLSELQAARFELAKAGSTTIYRTAFRRMRNGVPRWEMRDDGIAGCLRTSSGGSSKQAVLALGNGDVRIRWMTPVEYSLLMGAPGFPIDGLRPHHVYSGFGDAVCVPVVEWLAQNCLVPVLELGSAGADEAAVG